jgi:hypothetical protein
MDDKKRKKRQYLKERLYGHKWGIKGKKKQKEENGQEVVETGIEG